MVSYRLLLKVLGATWMASAINFVILNPAKAGALISVDTDILTPGIQTSLTVNPGDIFTIEVLVSDEGTASTPTVFDTVILETFFNDRGAVLGLGPTGLLAGSLAGTTFSWDAFSFVPVAPGTALTQGPSNPGGAYQSGSGAVGLLSIPFPFELSSTSQSIFRLDFTALSPGSTSILASGSPFGSPTLARNGIAIPVTLAEGTITVAGVTTPIPEPTPGWGLSLPLGAGIFWGKRRKKLKDEKLKGKKP